MKYAAFKYINGINIGDTIQTIAAQQYLPKMDCYLDRDSMSSYKNIDEKTLYFSNGFFDNSNVFPLKQKLFRPILIAVHLKNLAMLTPEIIKYLRLNGPVGCRDQHTYDLLQSIDVPSYYSSCITLTITPPVVNKTEDIFIVDVHKTLLPMIPKNIRKKATYLSHTIESKMSLGERMEYAQKLFRLYAGASLVITGRLHCALPCVAMKTPVILLHENPDDPRLETASRFIPVYKYGDTISWNPSSPDIAVTRQALQKLCYQLVTRQNIKNSFQELTVPKPYPSRKSIKYSIYKNVRGLYRYIPSEVRKKLKLNPAG